MGYAVQPPIAVRDEVWRAARLRANARASGVPQGVPERWHVLASGVDPVAGRVTVAAIKRAVAGAFGLTVADLEGRSCKRREAWPRQVAMYLARDMLGRSFPDLGARFGGRDHTTVLWAVRAVKARMARDGELARTVGQLRLALEFAPKPEGSIESGLMASGTGERG